MSEMCSTNRYLLTIEFPAKYPKLDLL